MTSPSEPGVSTQTEHEKALHVAHHTPWLHVPRKVKQEEIHAKVHGTGPMGRVNAWLALRITRIVGTMYCAYLFAVLAFVALPSAIQQGSPTVLINWLSSNFLQLILLPIIIVGQNVI